MVGFIWYLLSAGSSIEPVDSTRRLAVVLKNFGTIGAIPNFFRFTKLDPYISLRRDAFYQFSDTLGVASRYDQCQAN